MAPVHHQIYRWQARRRAPLPLLLLVHGQSIVVLSHFALTVDGPLESERCSHIAYGLARRRAMTLVSVRSTTSCPSVVRCSSSSASTFSYSLYASSPEYADLAGIAASSVSSPPLLSGSSLSSSLVPASSHDSPVTAARYASSLSLPLLELKESIARRLFAITPHLLCHEQVYSWVGACEPWQNQTTVTGI